MLLVLYMRYKKNIRSGKDFLKAIETGSKESYKDSISLLTVYIKNNKLAKAYELIKAITEHNDIAY